MAKGAVRITPERVMVIPAATAADAGDTDMFGNQIGGKRQQEQQDNLRGGFIPPQRLRKRIERPYDQLTTNPASTPPIATFRNSTVAPPTVKTMVPIATATANLSETSRRRRSLAPPLQNAHDFLRYPPFPNDARKRHGVGRRQHGRQRERRDQRNARYNPVDQKADADHRHDHQR